MQVLKLDVMPLLPPTSSITKSIRQDSRFYLSLDDDLLRIFGGERISTIMEELELVDGEPIEHNLISKAIENAQAKVEGHNLDIRKQLLEYDDVMNQQREAIYRQRREALTGKDLREQIIEMIRDKADDIAQIHGDGRLPAGKWDWNGITSAVYGSLNLHLDFPDDTTINGLEAVGLSEMIFEAASRLYEEKEQIIGQEDFRQLERFVMLQNVDNLWTEHLSNMGHLREGISRRAYPRQNPLLLYKKEGLDLFEDMISRIEDATVQTLMRIEKGESESTED